MSSSHPGTFIGFGFGAIQAGLFIHEALRSGRFSRIVVAEVVPELVRSVRENGGRFHLNVAHRQQIESVEVGPIEILDPVDAADREQLIEAIAGASEAATAVPSVNTYRSETAAGVDDLLARGIERRRRDYPDVAPLVVYAAENDNNAAAILRSCVEARSAASGDTTDAACFLDTVIGKMSGVIADPGEASRRGLVPLTPTTPRAFLVESFNRILVSSPRGAIGRDVPRALDVFVEKDDLLPFEEAKLYGHNASHALAAYLAARAGWTRLDELGDDVGAVAFLRAALVEESGRALIARHGGKDELFSETGFAEYVDDLLPRMLSPFLGDLVERVGRDPARKLGWNDRLIGAIRLCRDAGVESRRIELGAAAALAALHPTVSGESAVRSLLELWEDESPPAREIAADVAQALARLARTAPQDLFA